jgi:hypothetical protein
MLREATKSLGFCKGAREPSECRDQKTLFRLPRAQVLHMLADARLPDLCPTIDAAR